MKNIDGLWLESEDGDRCPLPKRLDVKQYIYLAYVEIPKEKRSKGLATKVITKFCNRRDSIFVTLCDSDVTSGLSLLNLFIKLGFKVVDDNREMDYNISLFRKSK